MNLRTLGCSCLVTVLLLTGCNEAPPTAPGASTASVASPTAQSRAACDAMVSAVNQRDLHAFGDVLSADFQDHSAAPGYTPDKTGTLKMFGDFFAGFPDVHVTADWTVADGNRVVTQWTTTGTNTGEFMGMPASNKAISITELHILVVNQGKIAEHTRAIMPKATPAK